MKTNTKKYFYSAINTSSHFLVRYKHYLQPISAGIVFACLTILTTYPLIWHLGDSIFGYPGDSTGLIWRFWTYYQGFLNNGFPQDLVDFVGAPFGGRLSGSILDPLRYGGLALTIIWKEVVAYNLLVLMAFWLSAFSAYLLAKTLWKKEWAAILTGVLYGFSPCLIMI